MKGKPMVSIGMAECSLGSEGAKVVAELTSVTTSLTALDVRYNELSNEDKTLLQQAVQGRSSFDLKV